MIRGPRISFGSCVMAGSVPRSYLDACVLISYIENDPTRAHEIGELFRRAQAQEIELLTSVISRVEVAYSSEEKRKVSLTQRSKPRLMPCGRQDRYCTW